MKISVTRSVVVVAAAAVLGLGVGGGVMAVASTSDAPKASAKLAKDGASDVSSDGSKGTGGTGRGPLGAEPATTTPWPTNDFGLTVGAPTEGDVEAGNLPDLMTTFVLDGKKKVPGFYLSMEVYPFTDDLLKQTSALLNEKGEEIHKIYAADGKTVLGQRVVSVTTASNAQGQKIHPVTGKVIESE